jgi:hypothetical protein
MFTQGKYAANLLNNYTVLIVLNVKMFLLNARKTASNFEKGKPGIQRSKRWQYLAANCSILEPFPWPRSEAMHFRVRLAKLLADWC